MEFIKKYWWCFIIALIVVPIALNFILLVPAVTPIVGDNQTWLSFIGTLIGALASFAMIFFTAKTLEQNNQQLKEMKRQWEEDHRPHLYGRIVAYKHMYFYQIYNAGSKDAYNVSLKINSEFACQIPEDYKYIFDEMQQFPFFIQAGRPKNFILGKCSDIDNDWKDMDFSIEVTGTYNTIYQFHNTIPIKEFVNKHHAVILTPTEDALETIASGLVKPNTIPKHKDIQFSVESIAKSLETIVKNQYANGTEQDK